MGWKRIGNHSYFYRSRREAGRVVSEYFGRGESASLMAQIVEIDQQYRLVERTGRKEERHEAERQERAFRAWFDAIEMMATGAMLADGYHQHHGQWRRKRHGDERPGGAPAPGGGGGSAPGE